jgi:hypothetical protein
MHFIDAFHASFLLYVQREKLTRGVECTGMRIVFEEVFLIFIKLAMRLQTHYTKLQFALIKQMNFPQILKFW